MCGCVTRGRVARCSLLRARNDVLVRRVAPAGDAVVARGSLVVGLLALAVGHARLYNYGVYSYRLYSYGLYSHGLWPIKLWPV